MSGESSAIGAELGNLRDQVAGFREAAAQALGSEGGEAKSPEEIQLAMLDFNTASAKFNAAIKTAQEEPNTLRRTSQGQQA